MGRELLETLLLLLVLLLRKRIHLAQGLPAGIEPLCPGGELDAIVALSRLVGAGIGEAAPGLLGLGVEAGQLDLDVRCTLGCLIRLLAHLDLGCAEPAQLLAEPGGALRARIDTRPHGRLEPRREQTRTFEPRAEPGGGLAQPREHVRIERRPPGHPLEQRRIGFPCPVGRCACLESSGVRHREQRRRLGEQGLAHGGAVELDRRQGCRRAARQRPRPPARARPRQPPPGRHRFRRADSRRSSPRAHLRVRRRS